MFVFCFLRQHSIDSFLLRSSLDESACDSHGSRFAAVATADVDSGRVTGNVNFGQIKAIRADKVMKTSPCLHQMSSM